MRSITALVLCTALTAIASCAQKADPAPQGKRAALGALPAPVLAEAEAFKPFRYSREIRGAHTTGAYNGGSLVAQALAAYAGNAAADEKLLEKFRSLLEGDRAATASGGYPAQHQLLFTGAAVVVKNTPRVWNVLSHAEKAKTELIIKSCLAGCAYTTSDANYADGARPTDLDGGTNFHRGWNPNFREGMIGMLLTGACFLGPDTAQAFLDTYDHEAFCGRLEQEGLTNPHETFNWKKDHPEADAPTPEMMEAALHGFRYLGKGITDPMDLYAGLTENTYSGTVMAGLNNGAGEKGAGKIASGAEELPNVGMSGMLKEFNSRDAKGARSSVTYAYDGFRPNLVNQIALITGGHWDAVRGKPLLALLKVGVPDLFYKLEKGYLNYAKGKAHLHPVTIIAPDHDYRVMRSVWEDVVRPYHNR